MLDSRRPLLMGWGGEVGRSFYWYKDDKSDTTSSLITPNEILNRMSMPETPYLLDRASKWLESLPIKNNFLTLDLLYLEQRLACWAGPSLYGHVYNRFRLYPFTHRRIIEIMLSLPPDYKRTETLATDIIKSQWSELLDFPFNKPLGIKKIFYFAHKDFQLAKSNIKN